MQQPKILVADDSRAVRATVRNTLTAAGFDVILAADGREAVQVARRDHPDLVILDIHMPELDGYSACEEILGIDARNTQLPIIFLTKDEAQHLATLGSTLGAYLHKPVTDADLLRTVRLLLQSSQMHQQGAVSTQ